MGFFLLEPDVLSYLPILFAMLSVIVISLGWLIANIFQDDMLKTKVKGWIIDLIAVFFIFILLNPLFGSPFGSNLGDSFSKSKVYDNPTLTILAEKSLTKVTSDFSKFYTSQSVYYLKASAVFQHYLGVISQYGMSGGVPGWYFVFNFYMNPYRGLSVLSGPSYQILSTVINIIFISQFIIVFLKFIVPLGPLLFLLGISIRFLPSAKSIGNILLALAIGLYILFPLSIAFVNAFNLNIMNSIPNLGDKDIYDLIHSMSLVFSRIPTSLFDIFCSGNVKSAMYRMAINGPFGELIQGLLICAATGPYFYVCFKLFANVIFPIKSLIIAVVGIILMLPSIIMATQPYDVKPMLTYLYTFANAVIYRYVLIIIESVFVGIFTIVGAKSVLSALGSAPQLYSFSKLV